MMTLIAHFFGGFLTVDDIILVTVLRLWTLPDRSFCNLILLLSENVFYLISLFGEGDLAPLSIVTYFGFALPSNIF